METVKVPARVLIGIRATLTRAEMGEFFRTCYTKTHQVLNQLKVQPCSPPVAYYFTGPPKFDLVGGFFVASLSESAREQLKEDATVFVKDVPEVSCLKKNYVGSYDGLPAAWAEIWKVMPGPEDPFWSTHKATWEEYVVQGECDNSSTDIYVQSA